jgi:PAS domain-containing protein
MIDLSKERQPSGRQKTKTDLQEEVRSLQQKLRHFEKGEYEQESFLTQVANALLRLYALAATRHDYLYKAVRLLNLWSRCNYLGIRLLNDLGQIPYESYLGFSRGFWESENWLSVHHDQCVCVRVVTGQPEAPDLARMSRGGSFFLDNSPGFLQQLTRDQRRRYRGMCIKCGFKSIAVVPIISQGYIRGVIHLADEEGGKVDLGLVTFMEEVGYFIGQALQKFLQEDEQLWEGHLRLLMERSRDSVSLLSLNGSYLAMNTSGFLLTRFDGPADLTGKKLLEHVLDKPGEVQEALQQAAAGTEVSLQYQAADRIGRPIRWEAGFIPFTRPDGSISKIVHLAQDVSSRRD